MGYGTGGHTSQSERHMVSGSRTEGTQEKSNARSTAGKKLWRKDQMSKWHGGKGDKARPVDTKKWAENYEKIWGKKDQAPKDKKK